MVKSKQSTTKISLCTQNDDIMSFIAPTCTQLYPSSKNQDPSARTGNRLLYLCLLATVFAICYKLEFLFTGQRKTRKGKISRKQCRKLRFFIPTLYSINGATFILHSPLSTIFSIFRSSSILYPLYMIKSLKWTLENNIRVVNCNWRWEVGGTYTKVSRLTSHSIFNVYRIYSNISISIEILILFPVLYSRFQRLQDVFI